jgi:hypothetical protein
MKELTRTYGELLQDKRVRSEQNKYEAFSRQRNAVLSKYRKVYQAYTDLQAGLERAQHFYDEMKETVDSLKKNVVAFVENRRSEGSQLLSAIEASKGSGADREQARIKELMERMSVSPSTQSSASPVLGLAPGSGVADARVGGHRPPPLQPQPAYGQQPVYIPAASPPITPRYQANGMQSPQYNGGYAQQQRPGSYANPAQQQRDSYNPNSYGPVSPPAHQQYFSPPPGQYSSFQQQPTATQYGSQGLGGRSSVPSQYGQPGWQPPPPPPGPPPSQDYSAMQASQYPAGPGGYASDPRRMAQAPGHEQQHGGGGDPWAGLSAWK